MYTVCFNMYFGRYHSCHISFTSATISLIGIYLISAPPWKCHPSFNTSGIELIPQALMIHRHLLVPAFPNLIHSNVCNATSAKVCHWLTCYYLSQIFFFFFFFLSIYSSTYNFLPVPESDHGSNFQGNIRKYSPWCPTPWLESELKKSYVFTYKGTTYHLLCYCMYMVRRNVETWLLRYIKMNLTSFKTMIC